LGNRLGGLIGGILTAQELGRDYTICWPETTWCGCAFDDLFEPQHEFVDIDINTLFNQNINGKFLIHENQTVLNINYQMPSESSIEEYKIFSDEVIVYYHSVIPEFFSEEDVLSVLKILRVKKSIRDKVYKFCETNLVNEEVQGIHFRKTDFQLFSPNEDDMYKLITTNPQARFFICSDSLETEQKFSTLNNTHLYTKTSYPEKLQEGSWNEITTDKEGRQFNFNINRSKQSVIEAFIDLLILSRTKIIVDSHSSFLRFAKLYNKIEI
jgi:hypothetical protein